MKSTIERIKALLMKASDQDNQTSIYAKRALSEVEQACGRIDRSIRFAASSQKAVASAAMAYVSTMHRFASDDDDVYELADLALKLAPLEIPSHEEYLDVDRPTGWDGTSKGPFFKSMTNGKAVVSRKPCLPGGDWSGHLGGLPVSFGKTPIEAAAKVELFETWLAAKRSPKTPEVFCPTV